MNGVDVFLLVLVGVGLGWFLGGVIMGRREI